MKLKTLFARYDVLTKKIENVDFIPGDHLNNLFYYHVLRHKQQHEKDYFTKAYALFITWWPVSSILVLFIKSWFVFLIGPFLLLWIPEADAWLYAFARFKNKIGEY